MSGGAAGGPPGKKHCLKLMLDAKAPKDDDVWPFPPYILHKDVGPLQSLTGCCFISSVCGTLNVLKYGQLCATGVVHEPGIEHKECNIPAACTMRFMLFLLQATVYPLSDRIFTDAEVRELVMTPTQIRELGDASLASAYANMLALFDTICGLTLQSVRIKQDERQRKILENATCERKEPPNARQVLWHGIEDQSDQPVEPFGQPFTPLPSRNRGASGHGFQLATFLRALCYALKRQKQAVIINEDGQQCFALSVEGFVVQLNTLLHLKSGPGEHLGAGCCAFANEEQSEYKVPDTTRLVHIASATVYVNLDTLAQAQVARKDTRMATLLNLKRSVFAEIFQDCVKRAETCQRQGNREPAPE